jgi:hypothetical protein
MAERSFKEEVQSLYLGEGEVFRGEGILAITKALLQAGVSYVGGYQGAPISHLMDVLSDANDILADLGVHFEQLELRHRRQHRSEGGAGPALPPSGGPSFALAALAGGRLPSIEVGGVRSSGSSHVITEHEYEGIRLPGAFSASDSLD